MWKTVVLILLGATYVHSQKKEKIYDSETCGRTRPYYIRHVRGGSTAEPMQLPWSVLTVKNGQPWCSGTLVSRKHVLTAAHCFTSPPSHSDLAGLKVRLVGICGTFPCNNVVQEINVVRTFLSEKFFAGDPNNNWFDDIVLLELDSLVPAYVHHACLPTNNFRIDEVNDDIHFSGLGARFNGDRRRLLLKVNLGKRSPRSPYDPAGTFFVYSHDRRSGCSGDSGGGAVSKINDRFVLVGVFRGGDCAVKEINAQNAFVDVPTWLSQIQNAMGIQIY